MSQAASFADSVNTMQGQSMNTMGMILMYYSDRHIKAFQSVWSQQSHIANYMEKKSVTALTEKKRKIMVQTREVFLEVR